VASQAIPLGAPRGARRPANSADLSYFRELLTGIWPMAPLLILAMSVLFPPEVRITLSGQTFYTYRIASYALLPWLIMRVARGYYRFAWPDLAVLIGCGWMVLSFLQLYGFARGFLPGAALALDGLLPYAIARVAILDLRDFRRFLVVFSPLLAIVALTVAAEALLQRHFVRELAAVIFSPISAAEFGWDAAPEVFNDARFGLLRAMGPFSHPILAGLFLATLVSLYFGSKLRSWPWVLGVISGVFAIFTFSSAALLGLAMAIVLIGLDKLQRKVSFVTWRLQLFAIAIVMALTQLLSQNGLIAIAIRFTLNPSTGYYRLMIWEHASQSVWRHPLYGIGLASYERPSWMSDSIDAFWLAIAVRNGAISSFALLIGALLILFMLGRVIGRQKGHDNETYVGIAITLAIFVVMGFTVSFFGAIYTWYFILMGLAATLAMNALRPALPAPDFSAQFRSR
jgi:hypothetical protein